MSRLTKKSIADNGYIIKEMDEGCAESSCNEICLFNDFDCRKCPLQKALNKLGRLEDMKESKTKAFKIYIQDRMGYEEDEEYALTYDKAIVILNNKVKKLVKQLKGDLATGSDFAEIAQDLRKEHHKIICRREPYFMYKTKSNKLIAAIPYWEKQSYEYDEWDIVAEEIILEEIEIQ